MWRYVILLLQHVIEDVSHYEQTKCVLIFTEIQRLQKVSKYIIRNYFVLNITLWSVKTKRSINTPTRSRKSR